MTERSNPSASPSRARSRALPRPELGVVLFGALQGETPGAGYATLLELRALARGFGSGGLIFSLRGSLSLAGRFEQVPCRGSAIVRLVRQPGVSLSLDVAPPAQGTLELTAHARPRLANPVFTASSFATTLSDGAGRELLKGELRLDFRHELATIILSLRLRRPER